MTDLYDEILIRHQAVNPPYLTGRGRVAVVAIVVMFAACAVVLAFGASDLAEFLVGVAATSCLMITFSFGRILCAWRDIRKGGLGTDLRIASERPTVGSEFEIECRLRNATPNVVRLEAMRMRHSSHVEIDGYPQAVLLPAASEYTCALSAHAVEFGRARIIGVGFAIIDAFGLFRAESHRECVVDIDVCFARNAKRKTSRDEAFFRRFAQSAVMVGERDAPDRLRPYQQGDSMRRIHWRRYASRRELDILEYSHHEDRSLVCIVDAGPHMRLLDQHRCSLADIVQCLAMCAERYRTMSIVAYDEYVAEQIACNDAPDKAMNAFDTWCMDALEWHPPAREDINRVEEWSHAATRLYRHFKVYRNVDFSRQKADGMHVDLRGLVQWYQGDCAAQLLDAGDADAASAMLHAPYDATLRSLIQAKCCMPRTALSPTAPAPRLHKIFPILTQIEKKTPSAHILWFSDFSTPIAESRFRKLLALIKPGQAPALAVVMPLPESTLNLNPTQAIAARKANKHMLSARFDIVER